MKKQTFAYQQTPEMISSVSKVIWALILILVGTYFRIRSQNSATDLDWLVLCQLLACLFATLLGILLVRKRPNLGASGRQLIICLVAVGLSVFFSSYPKLVLGYWILLVGTGLLTLGLVQQAATIKSLWQLEKIWLFTVAVLLIKDTITSLFFVDQNMISEMLGGSYRLGMGVTHANEISLLAAIGFWMTFRRDEVKRSPLFWLLRILFLIVIALSRTRSSMICLVMGGVVLLWFHLLLGKSRKGPNLLIALPNILMAVFFAGLLLWSFDAPGMGEAFRFFNRDMNETSLMSISGRTEIWPYAAEKIFDSPLTILFGHGYGVSRFVLNKGAGAPSFYAYHAHNTVLEALLGIGVIGCVSFMIFAAYSFKWLVQFRRLSRKISPEFALRAISVVTMLAISSLTESYLVTKLQPITMIAIFYLLALDSGRYPAGSG